MLGLLLEGTTTPEAPDRQDDIYNGITSLGDFFTSIWNTIPQLVYFVCSCCLMVIDFAQLLFRKIVGLDAYYIGGVEAVNPTDPTGTDVTRSGDMVLQLFQKVFFNDDYSVIKVTFISLIILAAILLVITTIAAILRNEYSPDKEKKNSKSGIIKNFFKAIASFAIIPVAAYMGIWLGNAVLYAIDSATAPQQTSIVNIDTNVSSQLEKDPKIGSYVNYIFFKYKTPTKFTPLSSIATKTALYNANRIRNDSAFYSEIIKDIDGEASRHLGILNQFKDSTDAQEKTAQCVDDLFMMNAKLKEAKRLDAGFVHGEGFFGAPNMVSYFDRYNTGLVTYYYDLWHYMWPVIIVFIMTGWKTIVNMAFGLLSRIIVVFSLLLVSPLICAVMPLDGGSALTAWRKQFVSNIISAYIVVFVFNLFQVIYPIITSISLFSDKLKILSVGIPGMCLAAYGIVEFPDLMFQFFFLIAGLQAITSLDSTIEKMFGREDKSSLIEQGDKAFNEVARDTAKVVGIASAAGRITGGAAIALAGAGYAGLRKRHDKKKEGKAQDARDAAGRRAIAANKSNSQIRNEATAAAKSTQAYQNAFDQSVGSKINNSFEEYKQSGGKLSKEEWRGSAFGEGSAFKAHNDWNALTDDQKSSYGKGGYAKFMAEQYNNSDNKENGVSYKDWMTTGGKARSEFERDADGNLKGKGNFEGKDHGTAFNNARNETTRELDQRISNSLDTGVGNDEFTRAAVERQQSLTREREAARLDYEHAKDEYNRRREVTLNTHRGGGVRFGLSLMANGAGGMFRGNPRG